MPVRFVSNSVALLLGPVPAPVPGLAFEWQPDALASTEFYCARPGAGNEPPLCHYKCLHARLGTDVLACVQYLARAEAQPNLEGGGIRMSDS